MNLPRAVVFDLDGTLTDTEVTWAAVRRGIAEAEGLTYPERATTAMMGMSTPEWARYCAEEIGYPGTLEEIAARVIGEVADAYRAGRVRLLPGAEQAVRRMAALGPVAVASSSPPILIDAGLAALGVSALVEVRVSSESVGVGKPDPAVYLEACRRLGVRPAEAVAVEDSTNGIRSAHAAGMKVVAVPPAEPAPAPDALALADRVIGTLDALDETLVRGLFA
nr:HAD family phosphatase [Propionibacterium sp.]